MPQRGVCDNVVKEEKDESHYGNGDSYLADEFCQTVELIVKWCLYSCFLVAATCHMTYLGIVADGRNHVFRHAVHNHCRTKEHVLRERLVAGIAVVGIGMF